MIRTYKYTLANFIPLMLFLEFQKLANIYFLIISILCTIKIISPLDEVTAWSPLFIVIIVSMIREGIEDRKKHK